MAQEHGEGARGVVVIGISGPSCSGKSSLAQTLAASLGTMCMHTQDDYFLSEDKVPSCVVGGVECTDWDCEQALDLNALAQSVQVSVRIRGLAGEGRVGQWGRIGACVR